MPEYLFGGQKVHIPSADEIARAVGETDRAHVRAIKHMYLPETLRGVPASNAITLGAANGQVCGPLPGYAWSIRRLTVTGLASGASPDVVNLFLNDRFTGSIAWQFNGNNFGYTFGKGQLTLRASMTFNLQSVGTMAATGTILLAGELLECPDEKLGELLA